MPLLGHSHLVSAAQLFSTAVLCMALFGCDSDGEAKAPGNGMQNDGGNGGSVDGGGGNGDGSVPENQKLFDGQGLRAFIEAEDYQSWERAPGFETRQPSNAPHSDNTEIFINDVVADALAGPALTEWPVGSIIAKDGYTDGGNLNIIAIMQKRSDGWFWVEYISGNLAFEGSPTICTNCHSDGDDFVLAFDLP